MSPRARAAAGEARLSPGAAAEVLAALRHLDSVELKLTVPAALHGTTIRGLPLDPLEAVPRQVFFFDTPDLALDRAGLVVRARRIAGGRGDTVVKLRPIQPEAIARELRRDPRFKVELDALPGGFTCSGSFRGRATGKEVQKTAEGSASVAKLFSKGQRAFFAAHAPDGLELGALIVLGPLFVLKASFEADLDRPGSKRRRRMAAELWLFPQGTMILELSLKCAPPEAFEVAASMRAWLASRGIEVGGAQQTKTRAALDHLAAQAVAEGAASTHRARRRR